MKGAAIVEVGLDGNLRDMSNKENINGRILAIATYKPKAGKEGGLIEILQSHLPT